MSSAIEMVEAEVARQVQLKREGRFQYTPKDPYCPETMKFGMVAEELGEVARCVLANSGIVQEEPSIDNLRKELTQLAALTVAWLECENQGR